MSCFPSQFFFFFFFSLPRGFGGFLYHAPSRTPHPILLSYFYFILFIVDSLTFPPHPKEKKKKKKMGGRGGGGGVPDGVFHGNKGLAPFGPWTGTLFRGREEKGKPLRNMCFSGAITHLYQGGRAGPGGALAVPGPLVHPSNPKSPSPQKKNFFFLEIARCCETEAAKLAASGMACAWRVELGAGRGGSGGGEERRGRGVVSKRGGWGEWDWHLKKGGGGTGIIKRGCTSIKRWVYQHHKKGGGNW